MGRATSESPNLQLRFDSGEVKKRLVVIAKSLGFSDLKRWLTAIAEEKLTFASAITDSEAQSFLDALTAMSETGKIAAREVLLLWLQRQTLSSSARERVEELQQHPEWVYEVLGYIAQKQPFILTYHRTAYSVRACEIVQGNRRLYLLAWCEDVPGKVSDEPEGLRHNRLFRLDEDAQVKPLEGNWREEGIESIEVSLLLKGRLGKRYTRKPEDIAVIPLDGEERQVIKRVKSYFLFQQEILTYANLCEVAAPASVREKIIKAIDALHEVYYE